MVTALIKVTACKVNPIFLEHNHGPYNQVALYFCQCNPFKNFLVRVSQAGFQLLCVSKCVHRVFPPLPPRRRWKNAAKTFYPEIMIGRVFTIKITECTEAAMTNNGPTRTEYWEHKTSTHARCWPMRHERQSPFSSFPHVPPSFICVPLCTPRSRRMSFINLACKVDE